MLYQINNIPLKIQQWFNQDQFSKFKSTEKYDNSDSV